MRLDRLRLSSYGNLKSFEIDFDEEQSTTVLLGRNGTGKSYLIEAVVEIFRELELGRPTDFAYELDYVCRGRSVHINADPARRTRRLQISIDGTSVPLKSFRADIDEYLPTYIFAYYSGWNGRLESHFNQPTRDHYTAVLNSADQDLPLRRMFFCRNEYSQLVLLAFFLAGSSAAKELLERYLGIEQFGSALFVLKAPWWGINRARSGNLQGETDARFWHARGAFRSFLDRLWGEALAPIRSAESVERDVRRRGERTDRMYLFIKDEERLAALGHNDGGAKELFGYLESLFLCDLIDEIRVSVVRTDGVQIKFTEMSEGEQQLLTVIGLLLFTQDDESLYLLDEPDTHLNPVWTYDFLELLQDHISAEKGQLIVSTHNPLMVGNLHRQQVRAFGEEDGQIVASEPDTDPIGVGIEGLLRSELYGLRSSLAPEVLDDIDLQNSLLSLETRTDEQEVALREASDRLEALGVTRHHPNPLFDLFSKAVAAEPIFQKPHLSPDELEEQDALASEILDRILEGSS